MITASSGHIGRDKTVVSFDGSFVTISRGTFGKNVSRIPVGKITQVHYGKGMLGGHGHIGFTAAGADDTIRFYPWKAAEFEAIRDAVEAAISETASR